MLNSRPKIQLKKIPLISSETFSITSESKKKIPLIPKKKESTPPINSNIIEDNNEQLSDSDNKKSMLIMHIIPKNDIIVSNVESTTIGDNKYNEDVADSEHEEDVIVSSNKEDVIVSKEDVVVFEDNKKSTIKLSENIQKETESSKIDTENKPKITLKKKAVEPKQPIKTVGLSNNISSDSNVSLDNMRKKKIGAHFYWFSKEGDIYDSDAEKIGKLKPNNKILWF